MSMTWQERARRAMTLCGAGVMVACAREADTAKRDVVATVTATVETVHTESFAGSIDAIGSVAVRPGHFAALGAPGPARVTAVRVAVGDRVRTGAILVELDAAPFDALVQGAAAVLVSTTHAQERAQRLVEAGIAPRKDLDAATADLAQATAAATNARRLRTLATLRSPLDGIVTRLGATLGATVDGTSSLVEVADARYAEVVLVVSTAEAALIARGADVLLATGSAEGGESIGSGTVASVAGAIDTVTRTVAVRVTPTIVARALRIGESVTGTIALAIRPAAILVPAAAVVPDGDAFRVFTVDSVNRAHARTVAVGARRSGRVVIISGLAAGERVVTEGAYQVDDGTQIVEKVRAGTTPLRQAAKP